MPEGRDSIEGFEVEVMAEQRIAQQIQAIFKCSIDIGEEDLSPEAMAKEIKKYQETPLEEARRKEFERVIRESERVLDKRLEQGRGSVRQTIDATFEGGRIKESITDKYFEIIPKEEGGRLLMLTDLHGNTQALKEALKIFFSDEKVHLASLGDVVAGHGKEQLRTLEVLLKLYTQYPERVHLLRGNCEAAVFPGEGLEDELYGNVGFRAWSTGRGFVIRLFSKMPVALITENGVAALHGSFPKPREKRGTRPYYNLEEMNNFDNYVGVITFPIRVRSLNEIPELRRTFLKPGTGGEIRGMLWGDINPSEVEGYQAARGYVSGSRDIEEQLEIIGGNTLFRGHQGSLLKEAGSNVVISLEGKAATFHSSRKVKESPRFIASIPLDQKIERINEYMFIKVE